jgi:hypothetical protein
MRDFFHHLLTPRHSNKHRAKILHIDSLVIGIALLIFSFAVLFTLQKNYPSVLGISYTITPEELLDITNKIRQENGVHKLTLNKDLTFAAANKANHMLSQNYWAHIAPDGTTPWVFIRNSGYTYLYAGENLGKGFTNSTELVNAWMASPSHRDNMLSNKYQDVGFAIAEGNLTGADTILVVEMFGTRYNKLSQNQETPALTLVEITPSPTIEQSISQASSSINSGPNKITLDSTIETNLESSVEPVRVAAIKQNPLLDRKDFSLKLIYTLIGLFIIVLLLDALIVERKKIARTASHNVDHIVYLIIIAITILIITRGSVL